MELTPSVAAEVEAREGGVWEAHYAARAEAYHANARAVMAAAADGSAGSADTPLLHSSSGNNSSSRISRL